MTNNENLENTQLVTDTQDNKQVDNASQTTKSVIAKLAKRWFIDAFSGMALGLFATLIAGTIIAQIGALIGDNAIGNLLVKIGAIAKSAMGAGIGAGIAHALKTDKLTLFACIAAGMVGAFANGWLNNFTLTLALGAPGNPIGAYLTALIAAEVCSLYAGKTKLDIILVPLGALLVAAIVAVTLCQPVNWLLKQLATGIALATEWSPLLMGIVIAAVMGLLLTLPTSSAAIWVSIFVAAGSNVPHSLYLAGGACAVGCACHMVGFAVMSFKENRWTGLLAQGLGTSMLQIPNLMKNPRILLPPTLAAAVCGALSTTVFGLLCGTGAGMGTSGLVGVIDVIASSASLPWWQTTLGVVLLMFVLPAVISYFSCLLLRKIGWVKQNDLQLSL